MYKEIETYIQRSADRYETIIIYGAGIWAERIVDWLSQAGNNKQLLAVVDQCGSSKIGKKIGALRNRETDYDRVYKRVIKDLQDGYLGKVTFDKIKV